MEGVVKMGPYSMFIGAMLVIGYVVFIRIVYKLIVKRIRENIQNDTD